MDIKFLGVGSKFPSFELDCVRDYVQSDVVTHKHLHGKWSVIFTWPFDFTFVCPTELKGFTDIAHKFKDCNIFGMSIDSVYVHRQWIDSMNLELKFPLLSDVKRELSNELGILDKGTGATYRATYIIDPELVIRSVSINDLSVGRNPAETLRLVEAFQTGKLCGCDWKPGDKTLN